MNKGNKQNRGITKHMGRLVDGKIILWLPEKIHKGGWIYDICNAKNCGTKLAYWSKTGKPSKLNKDLKCMRHKK